MDGLPVAIPNLYGGGGGSLQSFAIPNLYGGGDGSLQSFILSFPEERESTSHISLHFPAACTSAHVVHNGAKMGVMGVTGCLLPFPTFMGEGMVRTSSIFYPFVPRETG